MTEVKLYEVKHSYYCEEQNYFTNQSTTSQYGSWASFIEEEGTIDPDYNLLFRWDWLEEDKLKVFWMTQRKGFHRTSIISEKMNLKLENG